MREKETVPLDDQFEIRINWFLSADINHLFNEASFFRLHTNSRNDVYAQLTRISDEHVFATLCFYDLGDHEFSSPSRGTFGGVSAESTLALGRLDAFIELVTDYVFQLGAKMVRIKLAPLTHDIALLSKISNILVRQRWVLTASELNFDMHVEPTAFVERVERGSAKRLRKCLRENLIACRMPLDQLNAAYAIIAENRQRRGYPMTMTLPQVDTMRTIFPDKLFLFGVHANEPPQRLLAAAICMAVQRHVLYVLYWGDVDGVETYSPIVLLAADIYAFCQRTGYLVFDAGISTLNGIPNEGLINFKQRLGFRASLKPTFTREC